MRLAPLQAFTQKTKRKKQEQQTNRKIVGPGAGRPLGAPHSLTSLTHSHTPHTRPGPSVSPKPRYGGLHAAGCHTEAGGGGALGHGRGVTGSVGAWASTGSGAGVGCSAPGTVEGGGGGGALAGEAAGGAVALAQGGRARVRWGPSRTVGVWGRGGGGYASRPR